ncbi:U6 snRNA-associated Sm-like protein LSm1 [Halotydeus destructor]|nr:U6 snRNA-associated Sm-like protein LSm1 [Halotydeus destructor]
MVLLRDGRTLIGILRCIDQFGNLVLHRTIERIYVGDKFGDIKRGIFIIRGENLVLCGEIDLSIEPHPSLTEMAVEDILELQSKELDAKRAKEKIRQKALQEQGITSAFEAIHEDLLN